MKIPIIAILLTQFIPICILKAQEKLEVDWKCHYYGEEFEDDIYGFASDEEANLVVERIISTSGLAKNFVIRAANVPNAMATIMGQQRAILYNQAFMDKIKQTTNTDWAAISIMAHEIGHHLQGHTIQSGGSRPKIELEADSYSGFILRQMGASLKEAQSAMKTIGSDSGSSTHPPKSARLAAITNGWKKADALIAEKTPETGKLNKKPISQTQPKIQIPAQTGQPQPSSPTYVSRCVFSGDPAAYYLTTTDDIIGISPQGQVLLVGKRIPPTMQGFVWMYQTAYITYGVDANGRIWSRHPNGVPFQVGYVTNP